MTTNRRSAKLSAAFARAEGASFIIAISTVGVPVRRP